MDTLQQSRRNIYFRHFNLHKGLKGLEIGPFSRPTVLPSEAEMYYADYYTKSELKTQAEKLNISVENIPDVHYVLKSQEIQSLVYAEEFDFIIANHVLEHVVDPFQWLKSLEFSLKPNGRFLITLPDKRMSFDKFRPDTSLSHFIEDFINGGEHTIKQHAIEAAIFYDNEYVHKSNNLSRVLEDNFIRDSREQYHPGMHVHVFQAETFLNSILFPFLSIGWLNLSLEMFEFNIHLGEFSFSLIKQDSPDNRPIDTILKTAYDSLPVRPVLYERQL